MSEHHYCILGNRGKVERMEVRTRLEMVVSGEKMAFDCEEDFWGQGVKGGSGWTQWSCKSGVNDEAIMHDVRNIRVGTLMARP
jgi:hypothetical protein